MKKRALSLILALCLLMSLLPTTVLAASGTSNSETAITTYYKYTLATNVTNLSSGGPYYKNTTVLTNDFTETKLTEAVSTGSTDSDGKLTGSNPVVYVYTRTEYTLDLIAASVSDGNRAKTWTVGENVAASNFKVTAYYKTTNAEAFPALVGKVPW